MSLQELHIKALEQQVVNLTRDCHYLMSLLNSTDEIDWDSWEQGRKIKEDLERSKDFFDAIQRRRERFDEYEKERETQQRNENARKAQEYLKQEYLKRKAAEEKQCEEERQRELKLGLPWNRKKIDNVLFGHETFYDLGKFFDYLFQ